MNNNKELLTQWLVADKFGMTVKTILIPLAYQKRSKIFILELLVVPHNLAQSVRINWF